MIIWTELLRDDLMRDEGVRLKPYRDSVGKLTIGIGRNLDDVGISMAEAIFLLDNDIDRTLDELDRRLPQFGNYPENARRALANVAFNLGVSGLLHFRNMIAALDRQDYITAADEALQSKWAEQVGERANRIADLIRSAK